MYSFYFFSRSLRWFYSPSLNVIISYQLLCSIIVIHSSYGLPFLIALSPEVLPCGSYVHLCGQIAPPSPRRCFLWAQPCTYLKVYNYYKFHEKNSEKMTFNLSKKILSILALFVESPILVIFRKLLLFLNVEYAFTGT